MIGFSKKEKNEVSAESLVNTIWVSSFLAMIFTLPPLGIFLGIYLYTEELVIGAIVGFGIHFVILGFSGKISKAITKMMN